MTLSILFASILIIILLLILALTFLWQWSLLVTKAPFVPIPYEVLPDIAHALNLNEASILYDLGCGDGRVLIACQRAQPRAQYIGIEKAVIPFLFAQAKTAKSSIKILKKSFFDHDLSTATHIFVYLFPGLMNELFPKLTKELQPGTHIVSCDFTFQNKQPVQVIRMERPKYALAKTLYIYEF